MEQKRGEQMVGDADSNPAQHTTSPLVKALGSLIGTKMKDFFEHSFENFRAAAILISLLMTFTAGCFTALSLVVLSTTYLISGSMEDVAIAALSLGLLTLILVVLFFIKILRRPYWLKLFEAETAKENDTEIVTHPGTVNLRQRDLEPSRPL